MSTETTDTASTYNTEILNDLHDRNRYGQNSPGQKGQVLSGYKESIEQNKHYIDKNHDITNKILLGYDKNFEVNRKKIDQMNKEVMTKSELIVQNSRSSNKKQNEINALMTVVQFFIVAALIGLLHKVMIIKQKNTLMIIMVLWLLFSIYRTYAAYYPSKVNTDIDKLKATAQAFDDKYIKGYPDMPKQCPYECPGPNPDDYVNTHHKANKHLDTDYSHDKWLHGDYPEATWYNPRLYPKSKNHRATPEEEALNQPKAAYGGISKDGATYYTCEWRLGNKAVGRLGTEGTFKTTIPCERYPGYKMTKREICMSNPDSEKGGLSCQEV